MDYLGLIVKREREKLYFVDCDARMCADYILRSARSGCRKLMEVGPVH